MSKEQTIKPVTKERIITFTFGSIAVTVTGPEHLVTELKAATTNPYLLSDFMWLFTKSLKDNNGRKILIQCFCLSTLINELFNYLM